MFSDSFQNAAPPAKLDVGKVIGLAFGAIGRNWLAFGILAIVLVVVPTAGETYLFPYVGSRRLFSGAGLSNSLSVIVQASTLNALFRAAVAWIIWRQDRGESSGPVAALRATFAVALWIIGVEFARVLLVAVGLLLLIVPGIIALLVLLVVVPVCVVERLSIAASMRRSLELTRRQRLRLLWVAIILWLLVYVPSQLIAFTGGRLGQALWAMNFNLAPWLLGFRSALSNLIYASAIACAYVELRNIKEGVGADSVAKVFG